MRQKHGINSVAGRQRVLEEMLELLTVVPKMSEHVREGMLLASLAQRLGLSEQQVRDRYKQIRTKDQQGAAARHASSAGHDEPRRPHIEIERLLVGRSTTHDRLELPIVEAYLTSPDLLSFLQAELDPKLLENRALKRLYEIGLDFAAIEAAPTFEQLLGAIEHPDLKRLAVWIDEQARDKDVLHQLQDAKADDGCPLFLRRSIDNLKWRREAQSHQNAVVALTAASDGPRGLDAEAEALLRQASEFHQRRATRKAAQ